MINELQSILEVLMSVGIDEASFDPSENGTLVRGANNDKSILVYFEIPNTFTDASMSIQSVNAFHSRIALYNGESKTKIEFLLNEDETQVSQITIKLGRKKCSYRCSNPESLSVPKRVPGDLSIVEEKSIILTKEYIDYLSSAMNSLSKTGKKEAQMISIGVVDHTASISIFDGEDDSFTDELDDVAVENCEKGSWEIAAFQRVMKRSITGREETPLMITEHGIAVFSVGMLDILVRPIM